MIRINGIKSILVFKADVISQNLWAIYIFLPFYGFWNEVEIYNKISHWTTLVASSWFPVSRLFSSFLQFMWYLCSIQVKNIGMTKNVNLFGWQSCCTHQYKSKRNIFLKCFFKVFRSWGRLSRLLVNEYSWKIHLQKPECFSTRTSAYVY